MGFDYKVGEMGPMYGYQWRYFNKPYGDKEGGVDQFKQLIENIKREVVYGKKGSLISNSITNLNDNDFIILHKKIEKI